MVYVRAFHGLVHAWEVSRLRDREFRQLQAASKERLADAKAMGEATRGPVREQRAVPGLGIEVAAAPATALRRYGLLSAVVVKKLSPSARVDGIRVGDLIPDYAGLYDLRMSVAGSARSVGALAAHARNDGSLAVFRDGKKLSLAVDKGR